MFQQSPFSQTHKNFLSQLKIRRDKLDRLSLAQSNICGYGKTNIYVQVSFLAWA